MFATVMSQFVLAAASFNASNVLADGSGTMWLAVFGIFLLLILIVFGVRYHREALVLQGLGQRRPDHG
jgi:hypothetical protein